eukprot:scaffold334_cov363-Pavlova_lutheri.AAC.1
MVRAKRKADARRVPDARSGHVELAVREARLGEPHARAPERLTLRLVTPAAPGTGGAAMQTRTCPRRASGGRCAR